MTRIMIIMGYLLYNAIAFPQQNSIMDSNTVILADTSVNVGFGLYRVCPLLTHENKLKISNKIKSLTTTIYEDEQKFLLEKNSLEAKMKADTADVRNYTVFFGGLITIPTLTAAEKQTIKMRKQLQAAKLRIEKQEMKIEELKLKKSQLEESLLANKKKLQRRYVWGLGIILKDRVKSNS